jgi:hypothetical protein
MPVYLRRVGHKRNLKNGIIQADAFRCREGKESALSYTLWEDGLFDVTTYQADKITPQGDLPGILAVTSEQFASLELAPPTLDVDEQDQKYGHLHHVTPCFDAVTAERIAKVLTETADSIRAPFRHH